jgi:hypothetical protein
MFSGQKIKDVVDENIEQIKAHLSDVQNLFNEGMATKNDVLKVQVQLAEAELRHIDARNQVRLSKINLSNVIGIPLSSEVEIQKDIKPSLLRMLKNLRYLVESAYSNRNELKGLDYRLKAGESGVTLADQDGILSYLYRGIIIMHSRIKEYFRSRKNSGYLGCKCRIINGISGTGVLHPVRQNRQPHNLNRLKSHTNL